MRWLSDRRLVAGLVLALAAAAGLAIWLSGRQERQERQALAAIVVEGTQVLQAGLEKPSTETLRRAEAGLEALQALRVRRQKPFADAAEHYLVATRAIVERRLDRERFQQNAARSRPVLAAHMAAQGRRDATWIHTATELKKRVDQDRHDLERVLGALVELLDTLPESEKRLAAHLPASELLAEPVRVKALADARAELAAFKRD